MTLPLIIALGVDCPHPIWETEYFLLPRDTPLYKPYRCVLNNSFAYSIIQALEGTVFVSVKSSFSLIFKVHI